MKIDIITLFPKMFSGPFEESIIRRARDKSLVKINIHDLRKWTKDKRKTVDDRPYGGGKGMVLRVDVIDRAISKIKNQKSKIPRKTLFCKTAYCLLLQKRHHGAKHIKNKKIKRKIILLDPKGKVFNQQTARRLSKMDHLILICGHYEGVDARVDKFIDEKISIGEYVLTGGELPAMVVTEAVARLIPGVLEKEATQSESFSKEMNIEYPQYTRPENYRGIKVPKVLLSGDHKRIKAWREKHSSVSGLIQSRLIVRAKP